MPFYKDARLPIILCSVSCNIHHFKVPFQKTFPTTYRLMTSIWWVDRTEVFWSLILLASIQTPSSMVHLIDLLLIWDFQHLIFAEVARLAIRWRTSRPCLESPTFRTGASTRRGWTTTTSRQVWHIPFILAFARRHHFHSRNRSRADASHVREEPDRPRQEGEDARDAQHRQGRPARAAIPGLRVLSRAQGPREIRRGT